LFPFFFFFFKDNINVTLQAPGAQSQAPIIIQQADDGRNAMLLNSQAAHILSLQEQSRLDAERRRLADEERRQQERDAKKRDKEEKRKRKKLEEEKRRQQLRAAQLASDRERQMEIDAELRRQAAEIEDEKRRLRQRSGLEWFRNYYNLAYALVHGVLHSQTNCLLRAHFNSCVGARPIQYASALPSRNL
jgi:hypothetical protein